MKKFLASLILGVSLAAGPAAGEMQGNNPTTPLAVSATSGTVTFVGYVISVDFTNDGAQDVIVRVFTKCDTVGTITSTNTQSRLIKPGEHWGMDYHPSDCSTAPGYLGFAHVAKAGESSSLRWFAK